MDINNIETAYWDPIQGELSKEAISILKKNLSLESNYEKYQANPGILSRNSILLLLAGFLGCAIFLIIFSYLTINDNDPDKFEVYLYSIVFAFLPFALYQAKIRKLHIDLINYKTVDRLNWLYSPGEDHTKWDNLKKVFPQIFNVGNAGSQYIDNEFWGQLDSGRNFWLGRFHFTEGNGDNTQNYVFLVYAFKLSRKVPANFFLSPQNTFKKLQDRFDRDAITTEWNDFNKEFHIEYKGDRGLVGADILQTLSPDTMEKLYSFEKKRPNFLMLFSGDIAMISHHTYGDEYTAPGFSKFLKKSEIEESAIKETLAEITSSAEIAEGILPSLS